MGEEVKPEIILEELKNEKETGNFSFYMKKLFYHIKIHLPSGIEIFAILLTAYLFTSSYFMNSISIDATYLAFVKNINVFDFVIIFSTLSIIIFAIRVLYFSKVFCYSLFLMATYSFSFFLIIECNKNIYLTLGVVFIVAVFTYTVFKNSDFALKIQNLKLNSSLIILILLFLIMTFILASSTIYRHKIFSSFAFDFGIFTQMFEYMKTTGLPITTCERNMLLSHFAVHFSPIYYLMLPGYIIFSSPEYLLSIQAFFICAAVFPIYFLCRHFKLSNLNALLVSITYLVYPATINGAFFDFHENKFLPFIILCFIYFFEKKKYVPTYIFLFLTLAVKEDAALYIIFLGLFYLFVRKERKHGLIVIIIAVVYFIIVSAFMTKFGLGIMNDRFNIYYLANEKSLFDVPKNVFLNPVFFISNLFSVEKFNFVVFMLAPLLFIPLISKNTLNLLLVMPMIVINLMTSYPYQFNIGYQYTYGVAALLFLLFIYNVKDFPQKWQSYICLIAAFSSFTFMTVNAGDNLFSYRKDYNKCSAQYMKTEAALKVVPQNATVTADIRMVPHLYKVKKLYFYPSSEHTEYYVRDSRIVSLNDEIEKFIKKEGYRKIKTDGYVIIYKK